MKQLIALIDVVAIIIILFSDFLPFKWVFLVGFILLMKGAFFASMFKDLASFGDVFCGFYIFLIAFGLTMPWITIGVFLFLGQKAVVSWL